MTKQLMFHCIATNAYESDLSRRRLLTPQNIQILFKKLIFGLCRADCLWSVPNGDSMSLPKCLQKLALSSFARLDSR